MPKQIALFIDGTFNSDKPGAKADSTNVHKLFHATVGLKEYIEGVGGYNKNAVQGMTGLGTSKRIREAYSFLCENYERGDSIYIFGFSRGAFAARSLAGFAFRIGLLLNGKGSKANLKKAWKAYTNPRPSALRELRKLISEITHGPDRPQTERTDLPIHFLGIWDTVAAMGSPFKRRPPEERFALFHRHEMPRNVNHARHALALHECRQIFEPVLFTRRTAPQRQTLEQMWFPGAHADVGGGYKRSESGYAKHALTWMTEEAIAVNFQCDRSAVLNGLAGASEKIHQMTVYTDQEVRPALKNYARLPAETRASFRLHPRAAERLLEVGATNYPYWTGPLLVKVDHLTLMLALHISPGGPEISSALAAMGMPPEQISAADVRATAAQAQAFVHEPFSCRLDPEEKFRLTLWIALALLSQSRTCLQDLVEAVRNFSSLTSHPHRPEGFSEYKCAEIWSERVRFLALSLKSILSYVPSMTMLRDAVQEISSIESECTNTTIKMALTLQHDITPGSLPLWKKRS